MYHIYFNLPTFKVLYESLVLGFWVEFYISIQEKRDTTKLKL